MQKGENILSLDKFYGGVWCWWLYNSWTFGKFSYSPDLALEWRVTSEFREDHKIHFRKRRIDIANITYTDTPVFGTAEGTVITVGSRGNFRKIIMIYRKTDKEGIIRSYYIMPFKQF